MHTTKGRNAMYRSHRRMWSANATARRFALASAIAVVVTVAFLPGSGLGASDGAARRGQVTIPSGLAAAIHARLGAAAIRSNASTTFGPSLGYSVGLSADGTTALVGAPGVKNVRGAAYIFHVSSAGSWTSSATPTAALTHGNTLQLLGISVALSADGTTAFVGSPGSGHGQGAVLVFHVASEGAWASTSTPIATLTAPNELLLGFAGLAPSTDGSTLVVGSPFASSGAGGAYVFHVATEAAWVSSSTPTATLTNASGSAGDGGVGLAVAMSGDGTTALVGDDASPNGGGGYLYHVAAESSWASSSTPTAILSNASGAHGALGESVALSADGTVALLGAPGASLGSGVVDVFHASSEASWVTTSTPTAVLTNPEGSRHAGFGTRLSVSADGTTAFVSAPGSDGTRGCAYVFHVSNETSWISTSTAAATLHDSHTRAKDTLGFGVGLSSDGATALAGAPGVRFETGATDVFNVADAGSWASTTTPTAVLTDSALNACAVPRLKGMKLRAARVVLKARSCRLGKVTRVASASGKRGRVVSQSRKPGSRPPVGTRVAVKIKQ
jgi:hypothetical protein